MADEWAEFRERPVASDAIAGADPWAEFREPNVAADVAKSAGIGLAKGITGIPGFIGDLQVLGQHFSPAEYIGRKFQEHFPDAADWLTKQAAENQRQYGHLMNRGDIPGGAMLPSSADIQHVTEGVTGPWYEPQTKAGERTQTVASFIPQALATGGEAPIANLVKGAIVPGAASQAAGEATEGTWLETPARILGAITGAGAAHGAQAGVNAAKVTGTARTAAQDVGSLIGNPDITPGAVTRMAKDVRNDALTPASAGARMAELGPEAMMLDAGRQLQGRAEAIATQPGAGQNTVLNAVENRTGTFGDATAQRIKNTLNQAMGQSPDIVATTNNIARIVDQQAKPLYDSVMQAHPVVDVPADIAGRPAVAAAMRDVPEVARNYGEQLQQPVQQTALNAAGVPVTQTVQQAAQPSLRYWDYVKKALDDRINGYYRAGADLSSRDKADLGGLVTARKALVEHLDNATGGAYASARQVAANKPQLLEALEQGQSALNSKLLPEQLREIHGNMSIPQQAMLQAGMRREVERIIDTARNDGAAARRILDTNQNREKIAMMFGQRAADAIDRRIAAETHFQQTTESIARNSRTGVRQQLVKDTESPSVATAPVANLTGFAVKGLTTARQAMSDLTNERTRAALGAMSATPGHQVPDLVRILSGYNQAAAANVRPPVTPLAKTLARVGTIRAVNDLARRAQAQEAAPSP